MVTSDCLGGFLAFIFCHSNHASHVELSSVLLELPHPNSCCMAQKVRCSGGNSQKGRKGTRAWQKIIESIKGFKRI